MCKDVIFLAYPNDDIKKQNLSEANMEKSFFLLNFC